MFGMSLPEIIVILVVAVLVLGPDKLPEALVKFAKFFKYFKAQINSAKSNFEQEVRIAELKADAAKLKDSITGVDENVRKKLTFEELDELKKGVSDFGSELKNAVDLNAPKTANQMPGTSAQAYEKAQISKNSQANQTEQEEQNLKNSADEKAENSALDKLKSGNDLLADSSIKNSDKGQTQNV